MMMIMVMIKASKQARNNQIAANEADTPADRLCFASPSFLLSPLLSNLSVLTISSTVLRSDNLNRSPPSVVDYSCFPLSSFVPASIQLLVVSSLFSFHLIPFSTASSAAKVVKYTVHHNRF
jgi:hypothetical protein